MLLKSVEQRPFKADTPQSGFPGGFLMVMLMNSMNATTAKACQEAKVTELVRGCEKEFLAWLMPLVRRQSVTLDLGSVERIDAAGIAALVSLYASARQTGHGFSIAHPSPQVAKVLALVGLERILVANRAGLKSTSGRGFEQTAA
jgi:anti-anti-sigma factor